MKIERGSFTLSGTPPFNQTILFNDSTILADEIEFSTAAPSGSSSDLEAGDGFMTPTQQCARQLYADKTLGERSEQVNNKCILHYRNSGGSITKAVEAARNDMSVTGEFTLSVSTLLANHQIYFIARQY